MKRDGWVLTGLGIVAVTAIAASFTTLTGLALWVGWDRRIGWLLPLCLDVLALTAGRVWLSNFADEHVRRYAKLVSLTALGVSVLGNAAGHIVTMQHASPGKITLAIVVGAIPPIALAAVGDLATMAIAVKPEPVAEVVAESIESVPAPEPEPVPAKQPKAKESKRPGRPKIKEPIARAFWDSEREAGRMPTGAELARVAEANEKMGRTWRNRWLDEEKELATAEHKGPSVALSLVTT